MRILLDLHHEFLYEGLRILLEDRLGYQLYRPVGIDWFTEGYWGLSRDPKSADQILTLGNSEIYGELGPTERRAGDALRTKGMTLRYPNINDGQISPGIFKVKNSVFPDKLYRGITLKMFKCIPFDAIIATIPQHINIYSQLQKKFQPRAKLIFQVGNMWKLPGIPIKNILNSTTTPFPAHHHHVNYYQEFDLDMFSFNGKHNPKNMTSMMNYCQAPDQFCQLEAKLDGWSTKFYGAGNRDGIVGPAAHDIANIYKNEIGWLYHVKLEGEGSGFNLFNAAATGRPIITHLPYVAGTTCSKLLEHGKTCIDLAQVSIENAAQMMIDVDKNNYSEWSQNIYNKFKSLVDYNYEATKVKHFMENLR